MIPVRLSGCVFVLAAILAGQTNSDSGDIHGAVTDPGGGPVAHARISVVDGVRGETREFTADPSGEFHADALPPGLYRVRIEASGFAVKNIEGVEVRVGETLVLKTALDVGTVRSEVTVTAEIPAVDTVRTQQADTIDFQKIQELPVNERNYLGLALTTPGVVRTGSLVDGSDLRAAQTPQSGLSFGGGNGRGNGFLLDGEENYVNSGGVRPSVSQEAVEEFQVNRSGFTAEFGNALGGMLNTITRSGGNETHGNAFAFLRDSAYQARNFFDPAKSAYTRGQYGGTVGGAIRKDKTFYFAAFERRERHETSFVPIEQDKTPFYNLTSSQQALVTYLEGTSKANLQTLGAKLQKALIPANNPYLIKLFDTNSGNFPFAETNDTGSIRIDQRFSDKDLFFFRGNITQGDDQNAAVGALVGYSRSRSIGLTSGTAMVSNTYIFNPQWIGESRFMFGYEGLHVVPNDPNGPEIDVEGYGSFGRDIFLPATTFDRHYELTQNFSRTAGKHAIKFGVDVNPVRDTVMSDTFFSGRFQFGAGVTMAQLINSIAKSSTAATGLASTLTASGQTALAASLANSITSLQAFGLGIPLYYQQGFGNPNWIGNTGRYNLFVQDAWKAASNFNVNIGLRLEMETDPSPVPAQLHNFGPRFGFAYTPFRDGKTVIRGGYGLFFSRIDAQEANLPATLNGTQIAQVFVTAQGQPSVINPETGLPVSSLNVWDTLLAQGVIGHSPITLADIAQFGLVPGPNSPDRVIFGIDKNFRSPYAQQSSLEIQHAFGEFALSASYEFNRGVHEPRTLDQNLYYTGRTANGQPTFGFYNPAILQDNVIQATANSWYNALIVQATKRYSRHLALNAHYTFSKAEDESTDFNSDFEPNDQLNAAAEKSLSSFDQRHRFVASAIFDTFSRGSGGTWAGKAFGNWTLAPIFEAHSGQPFNVLAGYDTLGDNHNTTHRPFGFGRNVGLGPNYYSGDMRLSRRFALHPDSRRNVECIAEGFNLANRTNFRTLNNVVGTADPAQVPRPIVGHIGDPLDPYSFTSAYNPRQFQFALKLNF